MPKCKKSKDLIKIGVSPAQLKDLIGICHAAVGFAEERGLGDLEDMAETWKESFEILVATHKKEGSMPKDEKELFKPEDKLPHYATVCEKAEPQSESEIMCHYYTGEEPHHCPGPMGDECHYVIKNGKMVMAHKRCHQRDQNGEKKTPKVMIR